MKRTIKNLVFLATGLLPIVGFGQTFVFLYNSGSGAYSDLFIQAKCDDTNKTTFVAGILPGTIFSIDGSYFGCSSGTEVSIGISPTESNYNYSYCSQKSPAYTTYNSTPGAPNVNYTISYTNEASDPYQCF
ncbi:MAG: hypothetical protein HWD59_02970 [Coxiellaceae bacterium]|nr:MAG: hypothetical protein HWD59_02970 [Coxiellaceae bacterium]